MLKSYFVTDVGYVRTNNEDNGAIVGENVFVVADGMGGAAAGEKASGIVIDTVKKNASSMPLAKILETANAEVWRAAKTNPALKGMGTTATLCRIASDGRGEYAHVGDSRLYVFGGGKLTQITTDHSYVEELIRQGKLKRADARYHPMKNMLTRAIGAEENIKIDTGEFILKNGDKVLLATDGLTNMVSDSDMQSILQSNDGDPARKLTDAALAAGGRDNVTALAVIYHAD